jgi:hypothetical protein
LVVEEVSATERRKQLSIASHEVAVANNNLIKLSPTLLKTVNEDNEHKQTRPSVPNQDH